MCYQHTHLTLIPSPLTWERAHSVEATPASKNSSGHQVIRGREVLSGCHSYSGDLAAAQCAFIHLPRQLFHAGSQQSQELPAPDLILPVSSRKAETAIAKRCCGSGRILPQPRHHYSNETGIQLSLKSLAAGWSVCTQLDILQGTDRLSHGTGWPGT